MDKLGIPVPEEALETYSRAMNEVAAPDIGVTAGQERPDKLILTAAVGMHMHSQLLFRLLALAQASHAIQPYEPALKARRSPTESERASR